MTMWVIELLLPGCWSNYEKMESIDIHKAFVNNTNIKSFKVELR